MLIFEIDHFHKIYLIDKKFIEKNLMEKKGNKN